ncbi:MAG: hypothetical protein IJ515_06690 [Clostridia bacterium]|nr:hypothetical protein [Clostridia bacterium]
MKKIVSALLVCILLVGSVFALASCSNITESYAEKINEAAKNDEHYTYDEVMEDLGDNAIDITVTVLNSTNGAVIAVKGCETTEEIEEKLDAGEEVKGITVVIVNNKAISAEYKVITEEDLK